MNEPSKEQLETLFEDGGHRLIRKERTSGRPRSNEVRHYRRVKCFGGKWYEHRLLWILRNGPIPEGADIDHKNGVITDNRAENLRLTDRSGNIANSKLRSNNTSGVTGVYWHQDRNKWAVYVQMAGKPSHVGLFTDLEAAKRASMEARAKHFGEFSPFVGAQA